MTAPFADIKKAGQKVQKAETPADKREARAERDALIREAVKGEGEIAAVAEAAGVTTARIREITGVRKARGKAGQQVAQPDEAQNPEGAETVDATPVDDAAV